MITRWPAPAAEVQIERAGNPKFYKLLNYRLCVLRLALFMIVI